MIPALITAAAVAVGASVPIMIWAIVGDRDPARRPVLDNLSAGLDLAQVDGSATVAPPSLLRRTTTPGTMARLDRLLSRAGRPPAWPVEKIAAGKLVLAGAMGALGVLFLLPEPAPVRIALVTVVVVVAYFTPELLLHSRGEERQQQIDLALPDTLDQMTIAVEAGLGFEAAMSRAAKNGKGPLAEEFVRTLQDIQMGKSRERGRSSTSIRLSLQDTMAPPQRCVVSSVAALVARRNCGTLRARGDARVRASRARDGCCMRTQASCIRAVSASK
ncbi:type II secretion system F family protein [Rhodococcus hoagii]|nr:type II secretion system F family protein [Prescottella equi]